MTLVLSVVSNGCVVHASDRLVSANGKKHDPFANKTVIYIARDALAVIGYSGLAYLNSVPTDQRIAETLHGETLGLRGTKFGQAPQNLSVGRAALEIGNTFKDGYSVLGKTAPAGYAVLAGFQLERKARGTRPFGWELGIEEGSGGHFEIERSSRRISKSSFVLLSNPGVMSGDETAELVARLKSAQSIGEIEDALVEAIGAVAARLANAVGSDAMVVTLPSGDDPIRARYAPATTERVAYSPFVVAPMCVHTPSILVGTASLHIGRFEIVVEAPKQEAGPVSLSSQPRKPPP